MPRRLLAGLLMLACAVVGSARPAVAELTTTIDLNYDYAQENSAGDVLATTRFSQRYETLYETSLTSVYDFQGALALGVMDAWFTRAPADSSLAATLTMEFRGQEATIPTVTIVYEGVTANTESYREAREANLYSNNFSTILEWAPDVLPEIRLKYYRQRSYDPWNTDSTSETLEFTALKDIFDMRLEFNFSQLQVRDILPQVAGADTTTWSGKATYKKILWGETDFELAYEIKENYTEKERRGVFVSASEEYIQTVRTRLRNSLDLGPRMTLGFSWEYQFDQDLFQLNYDYKLRNKYQLDFRGDLMSWLKLSGEARRESDLTAGAIGEDDTQNVNDTVKGGFDIALVRWFQVAGKAELKRSQTIGEGTGGSVEESREEKYELVGRHKIGDFWNLSLTTSATNKHENGWLSNRESKVKAELKLSLVGVSVTPSYEVSRVNAWDWGFDVPSSQKRLQNAKLDFSYSTQLINMFRLTFSHQYGFKTADELDEYLNFESTLRFNESTRINVMIAELLRDLNLEGELERRATDTEHDEEPQLVEVSYKLKLDWQLNELTLGSTFSYNDKGNDFDDLTFNTKIGWKNDDLDMSGEYEIAKIFADESSEKRRLSLRFNYKF